MATEGKARRIRLTADARQTLVVEAALQAIAAEGFEGLRTRDIAASANITSATLHHHFATKEDLIAAVAQELKSRFKAYKAPGNPNRSASAAAALKGQFADAEYYRSHHPELVSAYREFVARAPRDAWIARLVRKMNEKWRQDILRILEQAQREGSLCSAVEPELGSHIVLHTLWGLTSSTQPLRIRRDVTERLLQLLIQTP